jgi:hypothetical protein
MTIQLSFDGETERYVRLMCTRKGVSIEDYILGNLEWDSKPDCLSEKVLMKIPKGICRGCEYAATCPDGVS